MAKKKDITDDDIDLLDELGVESESAPTGGRSPKEQRIIAGFEEIQKFVKEHGREPGHGEARDIFERLYAVRLHRIRASAECREVVRPFDSGGLLNPAYAAAECVEESGGISDDDLLAELGVSADAGEVANLVHVRSREEIKAAEEIAQREVCPDFDIIKPLFAKVQEELASGVRQTTPFEGDMAVKQGDLFILDGQKVFIAELGEEITTGYDDRRNRRLRAVYDNGTQTQILLRSFQRALHKDKASRRISDSDMGPLFSATPVEDDCPSGTIYVLRSQSEDPFIAKNRKVIHKIGVTGGEVKSRITNAKKDATYLLADVEVVATYRLSNINRTALENLLHRFFEPARLNVTIHDRFGNPVEPREWFLVPLDAIETTIDKLMDGTLHKFRYDPTAAKVVAA